MTVERADADAGDARDLLETDLRPDVGERRLRDFDQAATVALRVCARLFWTLGFWTFFDVFCNAFR